MTTSLPAHEPVSPPLQIVTRIETPAPPAPVPRPTSAYWRFYDDVADAQLAEWLPTEPQTVLDLSADSLRFAEQAARLGHRVVRVETSRGGVGPYPPGVQPVIADAQAVRWLRPGSVDGVVAESQALSLCLAAEVTAEGLHDVLRPGGRLLLVVESLVLGLARLAEKGCWAELADVPAADVVLIPDGQGGMTRCFAPEELRALLESAGFDVEWVRPRSVLSVATVERAYVEGGKAAVRRLVATECALAKDREGEATGLHLVASARRRD